MRMVLIDKFTILFTRKFMQNLGFLLLSSFFQLNVDLYPSLEQNQITPGKSQDTKNAENRLRRLVTENTVRVELLTFSSTLLTLYYTRKGFLLISILLSLHFRTVKGPIFFLSLFSMLNSRRARAHHGRKESERESVCMFRRERGERERERETAQPQKLLLSLARKKKTITTSLLSLGKSFTGRGCCVRPFFV